MPDLEKINLELGELSAEEVEKRAKIYADFLMEEEMNNELLRQQHAMAHAADLEDFSPFDTFNS